MNIILIGSAALNTHYSSAGAEEFYRVQRDIDVVGTYDDIIKFGTVTYGTPKACYPIANGKKVVMKWDTGIILEGEIAWENSSAEHLVNLVLNDPETVGYMQHVPGASYFLPSIKVLYALKMSHRYLKNSPHFLKTMTDIHNMRALWGWGYLENRSVVLQEFFDAREKATYNYSHPKLNQTKSDFFSGDGIEYVYDHDTIHLSVMVWNKPAYQYFKPEDKDVFCDKDLFFAAPEYIRLRAVYEESAVLALERSQIPFPETDPRKSFEMALMKVCTSITSGWFREFAWEHYYDVLAMYDPEYVNKFWKDVEKGLVKKL